VVYNGMPAGELTDVRWRSVGNAAVPGGEVHGDDAFVGDARVEVALLDDGRVAVRNSADPHGPALIYTRAEIEALIGGAKDGDFDDLLG
jgi:Domain of unknown function (DUF397)